jgi:V/A-type H+-transporting ATPase subunit E
MGHRELLVALRREGEEKEAAIRAGAEAEAGRMREGVAARRDVLRAGQERQREVLCAARRREVLAAAEREARFVRLRAEHVLAERLRERARACLAGMRREGYGELFAGLAAEWAGEAWGTVRVNPADRELAARHFPGTAIEIDATLAGGFEAVSSDGGLTVVTTLETRLERAWPDLLPEIVAELRGRVP